MKLPSLAGVTALATRIFAYLRSLPANEPLVVGQAVSATLTLGMTLGMHLTAPQIAGAATGVTSLTTLVLRALVTPAYPINPTPKGTLPP